MQLTSNCSRTTAARLFHTTRRPIVPKCHYPNTPTNVTDEEGDEMTTVASTTVAYHHLDHYPDNGNNGARKMSVTTRMTCRQCGDGHNDEVMTLTMATR